MEPRMRHASWFMVHANKTERGGRMWWSVKGRVAEEIVDKEGGRGHWRKEFFEVVKILKDRVHVWTVWIKKKKIRNLLNREAKQISLISAFFHLQT